ncbi:MAG: methyltransferase domain-containing protein [Proteobacteria bacterium]|nr:MAG: methyltransferase domain-containing protein [Pseudomonadota bacterium]
MKVTFRLAKLPRNDQREKLFQCRSLLPVYGDTVQSQEEKLLWQERWTKGQTGWDQGKAHPGLSLLLEHARREGGLADKGAFYSAGCGRAHSEAALARAGYRVRAVDLSYEAISEASKIYGDLPSLELKVEDLFKIDDAERQSYEAIFDRAMLCALPPEAREDYIAAMKARLKDGGPFCAILFRSLNIDTHPPYPIDETEAWRLLERDFVLAYAGTLPSVPVPAAIKEEWICVWRLRGAPV